MVLAAGKGSRLGYLGKLLPKTMVPVQGRPILWYALRALGQMGASEAIVATLASNDLVLDYLGSLDATTAGLRRLRVHTLLAPTRSPVETLLSSIHGGTRDLGVVAGDSMIEAHNLGNFVREFYRMGAEVGNLVVHEKDPAAIRRACEVRMGSDGRILEIREKPREPRWKLRGCATYLFRRSSLEGLVEEVLGRNRLPGLTDLVAAAARRGTALGFPLRGWEVNVNTVRDVVESWRKSDPSMSALL